MHLVEQSFAAEPALDVAVSHALLRRVAARELPATARVYRPGATVAFGRLDALRPGFDSAIEAVRDHGFAPVLRSAGGHAAAYTERAVVYEEITPQDGVAVEVGARFGPFSELIARALRGLGVDARVGEVPGEYCPGAFSVNAGGRLKLAGVAQRVIRGAALTTAALVVGDGARVRDVLRDVYARLELSFDERTAGALEDVLPGADAAAVARAVASQGAFEPSALDERTLALARELAAAHRLGG